MNLLNTTQSGFKAVGARTYTAVQDRDDLILMEKWLGYIGYSVGALTNASSRCDSERMKLQ